MSDDATAAAVFERYADRLVRQVGRYTPASPETVEDACSFAWLQWAGMRPEESRTWRWMFLVAWREAWRRLLRAAHPSAPATATAPPPSAR